MIDLCCCLICMNGVRLKLEARCPCCDNYVVWKYFDGKLCSNFMFDGFYYEIDTELTVYEICGVEISQIGKLPPDMSVIRYIENIKYLS